jgi:lipopolysaccharide transport protein LptA
MVTSRKNNFIALLCLVFATGLLGVAEAARAPCANQEIVVVGKPLELDYRQSNAVMHDVVITQCDVRIQAAEARFAGGLDFDNSRWTISGDVRITAEGGSLSSDKAVLSFHDKKIAAAVITGAPAQFEQQRDDGSTARGHANTIDYETTTGTVSFNTNAWISYGRTEISGQQFAYNMRTQSFQKQSKLGAASGDGRVRIVIQPDAPTQSATPDKEKEKKP